MRPTTILALLAGLAAAGALAGPAGEGEARGPAVAVADAYDPAALNESAMDAIRQGDLATAWILLERAARLAPYDPRIARNLRALDAHRAGNLAPAEPAEPAAPQRPLLRSPQAPPPPVPPEPPAIWPPKP